jgi:hypothetical protein
VLTATVGIGLDAITLGASHTAADSITFAGADGGSTTVLPIITSTSVNGTSTTQAAAPGTAVHDVLNFSNNAINTTLLNIGGGIHTAAAGLALAQATPSVGYDAWTDGTSATSHTFIYENTGTVATSELVELVGVFPGQITVVSNHQITV